MGSLEGIVGGVMEKAILAIVLIVALVGVVGLFTRYDFTAGQDALAGGDVTGNVVRDTQSVTDCSNCGGYAPVCARINNKYRTYPNACAARCSGAAVSADVPCENLPSA
jgi:hypothetical protein